MSGTVAHRVALALLRHEDIDPVELDHVMRPDDGPGWPRLPDGSYDWKTIHSCGYGCGRDSQECIPAPCEARVAARLSNQRVP